MPEIVTRLPTVREYESVVEAVGFRTHDREATETALANTIFAVCAVEDGEVVGVGRVVGDGAISFLLTNVMVVPSHQRRGIGGRIVDRLCELIDTLPYRNIMLEVVPLAGTGELYERCGFRASRNAPPGLVRWFHADDG